MLQTGLVQFDFPVKIISGINAIFSLVDEVKKLGRKKPFIITDNGIISAGLLKKVTDVLDENKMSYSVFNNVEPDPGTKIVEDSTQSAEKANTDIVIAVGGGSSIDTAKATCVLFSNKGRATDYEGVVPTYKVPPLPLITVSTTAGTGSEVSSAAIITDEKRHFKMVLKSPQIFAKVAILDPMMLVGIPPRVAAETGLDALTHAIEAYISTRRTFLTDSVSINSIRMIFKNLRKFVANTSDVLAALNMLNASCLAGIAMTTGGLGLAHALSHPLGSYGKVSHGMACSLLLPHILQHNLISNIDRYCDMAIAANPFSLSDFTGHRSLALKIIDEVNDLIDDLGLPKTLGAMGIELKMSDKLIDDAYNSFLTQINPRATKREDVAKIFEKIL